MKKSVLSAFFALLLVFFLADSPAMAASDVLTVCVDGARVKWEEAEPFVDENGRTLVPLRTIASAMNLEVEWQAETRTAVFTKRFENGECAVFPDENGNYPNDITVAFSIGDNEYTITATGENYIEYSEKRNADSGVTIINGCTYAPVRYLAEPLSYTVKWDSTTNTASVTQIEGIIKGIKINTTYFAELNDEIAKLPDWLVDSFENGGWTLSVVEEIDTAYYGLTLNASGLFIFAEKTIQIEAKLSSIRNSTLHEFGHYLDYLDYNKKWYALSDSAEWRDCFENEKTAFATFDGNPKYHTSSTVEYFAEAFEWYVKDSEKLRMNCPQTYAMLDEIVKAA